MTLCRMCAVLAVALLASFSSADPPPKCKAVTHYGVSGCEPLPDQTCPEGYHKQAVEPSNPQIKGPTFLMCVADKPAPKEKPQEKPPKTNR